MIAGKGDHYALEVKGDSMIEAGINNGDVVVIRETNVADNGTRPMSRGFCPRTRSRCRASWSG